MISVHYKKKINKKKDVL